MAQAIVGVSFFDALESQRADPGDPSRIIDSDLSRAPVLGIYGQAPLGGDDVHIGFEAGALFSWWRDDTELVTTGGGSTLIVIDNEVFIADLAAGVYVSSVVNNRVRLYAGLGPLIMIGEIDAEPEAGISDDSAFGLGGYVRVGAEMRLEDGSFLGLGVRAFQSDLEFDVGVPDVELEGMQVMLTFSQFF